MNFQKKFQLAAPLMAASCYSGLVTSRYTVETGKLHSAVRIVLLADLHGTWHGDKQQELVRRIAKERPDLILMAGDMIDERRSFRAVGALLRGIAGLAPIYYVTGNHEYRISNIGHYLGKMRKMGVTVLNDSYRRVCVREESILLAGARDPEFSRFRVGYRSQAALKKTVSAFTDEAPYRILLAHRPDLFPRYARYPFDLVVSGHAHGGQARLPGANLGLYSHGVLFPKYTAGVYELSGSKLAVSRGLSRFVFPPRVFNPPEVVVITIEPI